MGAVLHVAAVQAFVDAMGWTCIVGAAVALVGALIALVWMPSSSQVASATATVPAPTEADPAMGDTAGTSG